MSDWKFTIKAPFLQHGALRGGSLNFFFPSHQAVILALGAIKGALVDMTVTEEAPTTKTKQTSKKHVFLLVFPGRPRFRGLQNAKKWEDIAFFGTSDWKFQIKTLIFDLRGLPPGPPNFFSPPSGCDFCARGPQKRAFETCLDQKHTGSRHFRPILAPLWTNLPPSWLILASSYSILALPGTFLAQPGSEFPRARGFQKRAFQHDCRKKRAFDLDARVHSAKGMFSCRFLWGLPLGFEQAKIS